MPTNLNIDDKLLNKAKRVGKHKTKREAVNAALQEYVRRHGSGSITELFGTMEEFDDFDISKIRRREAGLHESDSRQLSVVAGSAAAGARRNGARGRRAA